VSRQQRITRSELMLATPAKAPFAAQGWIFELKYDGFRCLTTKRSNRKKLESRRGRDMAASFPEVVDALRAMPRDFVIDGELVICDERGCQEEFHYHHRRVRLRTSSYASSALQ
jgi:bifunctional non-homologous end joining protein LigD